MYVRSGLLEVIEPTVCGWMSFEDTDDFTKLTDYNPNFHSDGRRFEMVTLPFQDFFGMTESITMLIGLGVENIAAYTRLLKEPLLRLADAGRFDITSPTDPDRASAIVCVVPRDLTGAFQRLNEANVVCSMREGAIRLSPHCYNTEEEMERVAGILAAE